MKKRRAVLSWDSNIAHANELMFALREGLNKAGYKSFLATYGDKTDVYKAYDLAVFFGFRDPVPAMVEALRAERIPSLILEAGYVKRAEYFQVGVGRLNWLPEEAPSSDRFDALGLERTTKRQDGTFVMVCGQMVGDAQHRLDFRSMVAWIRNTFRDLAAHTDRELVYRPHPAAVAITGGPLVHPPGASRISDPLSPLDRELQGAHALVTYNSTAGLLALLAGVPVFCNKSAFYADLVNTKLSKIEKPVWKNTKRFFERLAYAQWTLEELRGGAPLEFLTPYLEREKEYADD